MRSIARVAQRPLHASIEVKTLGVFLFGYFCLDKQEKVTCRRSTTDIYATQAYCYTAYILWSRKYQTLNVLVFPLLLDSAD